MQHSSDIAVFWFRRDLRLEDNHGLWQALRSGLPVLPVFIFDSAILEDLEDRSDARVSFIHQELESIQDKLKGLGRTLWVKHGEVKDVWSELIRQYPVKAVYTNEDYEPYALSRDQALSGWFKTKGIAFHSFKDQVVFAKDEIVKDDGKPYTVFTPYSRKWKLTLGGKAPAAFASEKLLSALLPAAPFPLPALAEMGFRSSPIRVSAPELDESCIRQYEDQRNIPGVEGTTRLGVHLRFGTVSVRRCVRQALKLSETWLNELIWREFFMQILWHFPHVVHSPFREDYRAVKWRDDEDDFRRWCEGRTGFPLVDAGMRELNATGWMHNRVRMVTAGFLTKDLLIDWRRGEAYFASRLLDFDLSANNGNWQWAAGTGCDAAPYFRIFNPVEQQKKFDPDFRYIRKWVPEFGTPAYPLPMLDHSAARTRCLAAFKQALGKDQ